MNSFKQFLIESNIFTYVKQYLSKHENPEEVEHTLELFKKLKNNHRLDGEYKDLMWWMTQPFISFKTKMEELNSRPSKKQTKKMIKSDSIVVDSWGNWVAIIPLTKESSCLYGRNTKWCTATQYAPNYFDGYLETGTVLVYLINKHTNEKFALQIEQKGLYNIFNSTDIRISTKRLTNESGISSKKLEEILDKVYKIKLL